MCVCVCVCVCEGTSESNMSKADSARKTPQELSWMRQECMESHMKEKKAKLGNNSSKYMYIQEHYSIYMSIYIIINVQLQGGCMVIILFGMCI